MIRSLLFGGLRTPEDEETRRRIAIFNGVTLVGIITSALMGLLAYSDGNVFLFACDQVVALTLALTYAYHWRSADYRRAAATGLSIVGAFFSVLFLTGGEHGTGHLWSYTFPLISMFLLGGRFGVISSLTMLLVSIGVLGFSVDRADWIYPYSPTFITRFIPSYLIVLTYSYLFEKFRENAHCGMERRVEERTADLTHSHERFTTVMDSIDANVYVADMETHEVLFMNRRMLEQTGGNAVGRQCYRVVRGKDAPCRTCTNPLLVDENGAPTGVVSWESRNELTSRWFLYHDRAIRWVDGRIARLQVATDLTKRKQAEEENARLQSQLLQAQKMEAIGTLAGGVAHDLNNILAGIVGYPDLILRQLPEDTTLRSPLTAIRDSGERAARIVQDLLTLARRRVTDHQDLHIEEIVDTYLSSPEFLALQVEHPDVVVIPENVEMQPALNGSKTQIFKTIMNLVTNAFEAMDGDGTITIGTEHRILDRPTQGYTMIPAGDYVVLSVEDTGEGIPPDDLPRIFEPFFTRKPMGRSGTGLGMAVVWGTVLDHKGYVDLRSAPGKGSRFSLFFPVAGEEAIERARSSIERSPRGGGECILVVDDTASQRDLVMTMLSGLGYAVEAVASGEEAIDRIEERPFDLILLDMIMSPGMDGLDTFRRISDIRPGQKALITSGFAETERVTEAQNLGAGKFLRKPFRVHELGAAVREELGQPTKGKGRGLGVSV